MHVIELLKIGILSDTHYVYFQNYFFFMSIVYKNFYNYDSYAAKLPLAKPMDIIIPIF